MNHLKKNTGKTQLIVLCALALFITGVLFVIDVFIPLGVAIGAVYCIVILYSWLLPGIRSTIISAAVCSVLILIAYQLSPEPDPDSMKPAVNRLISLIVIWVCASLVVIARKSFDELTRAKEKLEELVEERTARLRDSEQVLRDAQVIGKMGSWAWFPDSGKVVWSDQMYRLLGLDPPIDREGQVEDLFDYIHPDDKQMVQETTELAAKEKRAIPLEYRIIDASGKLKYVFGQGSVEYDEHGEMIKMVGTLQDITELAIARNEFSVFWNNSLELMCIANTEGYFERLNPLWQQVLGYDEEELKSRPFVEFVHPEDQEATLKEAAKLAEGHSTVEFVNRYKAKDGTYRWLMWTSGVDADLGKLYATARDITSEVDSRIELEKYANNLEAKNAALKEFVYVASHDLQEPLRVVHSYMQLLQKKYDSSLDEKGLDYIERASNAAARMKTLINDLLALSRIDTRGKSFEDVELQDLMNEVAMDLQVSLDENNATIKFADLPPINGDRTQVKQLLQNLVSNAIKFKKPDVAPEIEVSAKIVGKQVQVSVKDNGIGIEDEYVDRIFTIFQRLHTRDQYEGTGIGLAICKKIVERHQGTIEVKSVFGLGSEFRFTLPDVESTTKQTTKKELHASN